MLEVLRRYRICWSALGDDADTEAIREITRAYNHSIVAICDQLAGSPIDCRHDQGGLPEQSLFGADFGPADLSPLDHFHPSLKGQARIAGVTWGRRPGPSPDDGPRRLRARSHRSHARHCGPGYAGAPERRRRVVEHAPNLREIP